MSNSHIKNALWAARRTIRSKLSDLNETAAENREQLRYHQSRARYYKAELDTINKQKGVLRRELKKSEDLEYSINPIKNIQKAKEVANNE